MEGIDWTSIINTLIQVLLVPLVMWAVAQGALYLKKKTKQVNDAATQLLLNNAEDRAIALIQAAVMETTQTFVSTLKAQGNFTEDAAKVAFDMTYQKVLLLLGTEGKAALKGVAGDVEAWLKTKIEATVLDVKVTSIMSGG
jgi:hypothetical protein